MKRTTSMSGPIFFRVFFFNLLACLTLDGGVYWLKTVINDRIAPLAQAHGDLPQVKALTDGLSAADSLFWPYFVPASLLFFVILTLLAGWSLSRAVNKRIGAPEPKKHAPKPKAEKAPAPLQQTDSGKRLYLHLLAVLQKEGRLLDFFSEDLTQYQDGQIGAAVRSIHENCKKTLKSHITPQFILDQEEGQEITVDKDFDPNTLKLVGNVTGTPPFKGIVRHRGWRAQKLDLPTFSGEPTPGIIAPAEVEIR